MGARKALVLAGRCAAVTVAALAAACSHVASAAAPPAAGQTPGPATPTMAPSSVPVLGPMTLGSFPATRNGKRALIVCEQWAGLREQYVPRVRADTAYQLEQWFSSTVWQAAYAASGPLQGDPAYTNISVAFRIATEGDVASIANAMTLDRACAAAD
jgi:hypothetical protein